MKNPLTPILFPLLLLTPFNLLIGQNQFSDFQGLSGGNQDQFFHLPSTHTFQVLVETGDNIIAGGHFPTNPDFTGYVPINGSSSNGYLSVNSENTIGDVTVFDINLNPLSQGWEITHSQMIDFTAVEGTSRNCSGGVTPWGTIISCEEANNTILNQKGYRTLGWAIEIDPASKSIIDQDGPINNDDKLWALGNFAHENASIHPNQRTIYQGIDSPQGYLYKFIADTPGDLSEGLLFVYKGPKNGNGQWIQIPNSTVEERNHTILYSSNAEATIFAGVEDVEYNPIDGLVYLAVKDEEQVYRFQDDDPLGVTVTNFETHVGGIGVSYFIENSFIPWGNGNDNMAFDESGNLYVYQDGNLPNGDQNYIWFVEQDHTVNNPKVKIFARTPVGSEPTGITFSPDFKYLFMSLQHPSSSSQTFQEDALGNLVTFNKGITLVIARNENLGIPSNGLSCTNLITPEDGTNEVPVNSTLEWAFVPNATGYVLQVGTEPNGTDILETDVGNVSFYDIQNLPYATIIYVSIQPYNNSTSLSICNSQSFMTENEIGVCNDNIPGFIFLGAFQNHHYFISDHFLTWPNAKIEAEQIGVNLVSINSMQENEFLFNNIDQICLIGLSDLDLEGSYIWESGEPFNYNQLGSPGTDFNDDFGVIYHWNGEWTMVNQWVQKPFLIELSCNNSAEVLTVNCPEDQIYEAVLGETQPVNWTEPIINTTCPGNILNITQTTGPAQNSIFQIGQTELLTYIISDNCGNTNTCSFTVSLLPNCPDTLLLPVINLELNEANLNILSNGILAPASNIIFHAGTDINLDPGFCVPLNSQFTAEIQPCNANNE